MNNLTLALPTLLPAVIALAKQAGAVVLSYYEAYLQDSNALNIQAKADSTPLTAADLASHRLINRGLKHLTPQFPVLSEESSPALAAACEHWHTFWLIDPLDGTREFINRVGEFTLNIALIQDGSPILGVIYVPVEKTCYFAATNLGAYKQSYQQPAHKIHCRTADLNNLVALDSRSHAHADLSAYLAHFPLPPKVLQAGSALKFCWLAEGRADLYLRLGPTCCWDTAAGHCIVMAAGGIIRDLQDRPLCYNVHASTINPPFIAAGDPIITNQLRQAP